MAWPVFAAVLVALVFTVGLILRTCGTPSHAMEKVSSAKEIAAEEKGEEIAKYEKEMTEEKNEARAAAAWRRDAAWQPAPQDESDTDSDSPEAETESEPE